ncbi:lanC-like protein 2 [Halyomorpha halys]|uniref:lanC-like protein 2 n=1 Tax=Halyomorpha halys TaxID=286706 RepID=UPI0006D4D031|nr:lanC-like protein 2 [Halyomorpha halys]XP_024218024.1 lanC-like protein 2 [Halyomorpha halys]
MDGHRYLNPYSDKCLQLFLTEDGNLQEELVSKIKEINENFDKEIRRTLPMFKPTGDFSVYTGYCGTALLYLLKYKKTNDKYYLDTALKLADDAVDNIDAVSHMRSKRLSFLNGISGPLALAIVLHKLNGEEKKSDQLIKRLLELDFESVSNHDEVLYGRAGYLYSLLFVDKYYGPVIPLKCFRKVIYSVIKSGWKRSKYRNPQNAVLSFQWHNKNYFGAAHGVAGILNMLLHANEMLSEDERTIIIPNTLKWLADQKYTSGNFISSQGSNKDRLVQWCHGSPGFINLFLLAYKVYGNKWMLQTAIEAGDVVWERGLISKGYSICHGVAGNAYSFLALYNVTKEPKYLYRAACFADWCTQYPKHQGMAPDRPYSLYEGIAGISYFLTDLLDPENSAFPGYAL